MRKFLYASMLILVLLTTMCVACSNTEYRENDSVYRIEAIGYEQDNQETIYVEDIIYNDYSYRATIYGELCIPGTQYLQSYTIEKQIVFFEQYYGHIWVADVVVAELDIPIEIFASRAGNDATGNTKTVECGERTILAIEMKNYTYIKYLFFGDINYLKY